MHGFESQSIYFALFPPSERQRDRGTNEYVNLMLRSNHGNETSLILFIWRWAPEHASSNFTVSVQLANKRGLKKVYGFNIIKWRIRKVKNREL
jgi:hypothetical protein